MYARFKGEAMLAYDRRGVGDGPGLHALIVGVSHHDHLGDGASAKTSFGLSQLSRSARTAATLAKLLIERADKLICPLKTCRLMLSPAQDEACEIDAALAHGSARLADVQAALMDWHHDASLREDDATLFFFCGHGIQQSVGSSYLLMQDWLGGAQQPLDRALYLLNIYNGMRNGDHQPHMARTQLYIVDACRNSLGALADFENATAAQPFLVRRGGVDDRVAPIFYSSAPGHNAWSPDPNGPTLFGGQLISCLAGGAAEKRVVNGSKQWVVSIADLAEGLSNLTSKFNRDRGGQRIQTFAVDHQTDVDAPIHFLDGPPTVDLVLSVNPEDARIMAEIQMAPPGATPLTFGPPIDPLPYRCKVAAGTYALHVALRGNGGAAGFAPPPDEYIAVKGPAFEHVVSMSPL